MKSAIIAAIVAAVVASGSALAATRINGRSIKRHSIPLNRLAHRPVGKRGLPGPQGNTGPQGLQGPRGLAGGRGPAGRTGAAGPAGAAGSQGPAGADGASGTDCSGQAPVAPARTCPGVTGSQGAQGLPGTDGQSVTSSSLTAATGPCTSASNGVYGSAFTGVSGTTYACTGPQGATTTISISEKSKTFTLSPGDTQDLWTSCSGGYVVDGGYFPPSISDYPATAYTVIGEGPENQGWGVWIENNTASTTLSITVDAICATTS